MIHSLIVFALMLERLEKEDSNIKHNRTHVPLLFTTDLLCKMVIQSKDDHRLCTPAWKSCMSMYLSASTADQQNTNEYEA
jgi:hypothetical protein